MTMMMPSVTFKKGVRTYRMNYPNGHPIVTTVQPEINNAIAVCAMVYGVAGTHLVGTSLMDGKHSQRSLNYKGLAVDICIRNLSIDPKEIIRPLQQALGEDYDVVLESDHIHVEYEEKPYVEKDGRKPVEPRPAI